MRGSDLLPPPEHFEWVRKNQPMVLGRDPSFETAAAYVQGFDDATNALDGFHGWLVNRLGTGQSLHWHALVKFDFLDLKPVHHSSDLPPDSASRLAEANQGLVEHLFKLLREFFAQDLRASS